MLNPERSQKLAALDRRCRSLFAEGLSWFEDVNPDSVAARLVELQPLYVVAKDGPTYNDLNDAFDETRRSIWIKHPPTGTP